MRAILIALVLSVCAVRSVVADDIYTLTDGKDAVTVRNAGAAESRPNF